MKYLLVFFFAAPFQLLAQKSSLDFYASPAVFLRTSPDYKSPIAGGGINGGLKFKKLGLGGGLEFFKVFSDLKAAVPVFLDVRYFFAGGKSASKTASLVPFIGADIGKLIWPASSTAGAPSDNYTNDYEGKMFFNVESGIVLSKNRKSGLLLAVGFRNYKYERTGTHRTTRLPTGGEGPLVVTKDNPYSEHHSEFILKLGYQF